MVRADSKWLKILKQAKGKKINQGKKNNKGKQNACLKQETRKFSPSYNRKVSWKSCEHPFN